MSAKQAEYSLQILEHHLDTFGHVNHATYLEIFEEARWDLIHHQGFGVEDIKKFGVGPVILKISVEYNREVCNREKIKIFTEARGFRGKIGSIYQIMVNDKGETCSELDMTYGIMDLTQRKLIAPPENWLTAVGEA